VYVRVRAYACVCACVHVHRGLACHTHCAPQLTYALACPSNLLYAGGYGADYALQLATYVSLASGTAFAVTPAAMSVLGNPPHLPFTHTHTHTYIYLPKYTHCHHGLK